MFFHVSFNIFCKYVTKIEAVFPWIRLLVKLWNLRRDALNPEGQREGTIQGLKLGNLEETVWFEEQEAIGRTKSAQGGEGQFQGPF